MPKKLIVCCDGTWNTPERDDATNVVNVTRAIEPRDSRGNDQVVFYEWGIGTANRLDKAIGGTTGRGLNRNIREAYRFLTHNYATGDSLYFFGFSRGAYTVRSLAGMIHNCGLLKKEHSGRIGEAFEMYRSRLKKFHPDESRSIEFRNAYSRFVKIKFLGVWDTVGALGIPLVGRLARQSKYRFHDTKLSPIIECAYHPLAIDERRAPFKPSIWAIKRGRGHTAQPWFAGAHSDVGGGYKDDHGLADVTLNWMAERATECGLQFNETILDASFDRDTNYKVHDSHKPRFGLPKRRRMLCTSADESVHHTVREWVDEGSYAPGNLPDGWRRRVSG
jgi:uncharacterized protein (DUF2235 family)